MTLKFIFGIFICFICFEAFNQLPSVAVGPIKTAGVDYTIEQASTLTRFEIIKIGKYNVLDKFDMNELKESSNYLECFGRDCLIEYGKKLKVDYMIAGNIDNLGSKIVINLKLISIQDEVIVKNKSVEFMPKDDELQRMLGIVVMEMHDIVPDLEVKKRLVFNNDPIITNNVGRAKNWGPRVGVAGAGGSVYEFFSRPKDQGGLDIQPIVTTLGFQFEVQYVGTDKFSALFEFIPTLVGLEQGQFIPSVLVLNGLRVGDSGWEIAFGPSIGLNKTSRGFFDTENAYGLGDNYYWTQDEYYTAGYNDKNLAAAQYEFRRYTDARGPVVLTTKWVIAIGRTFRSGALNVPVNIFYSSQKKGGLLGLNIGFNITKSTQNINR